MITILVSAMSKATADILADGKTSVFGGGRPPGRRAIDAFDINCGMCEDWAEMVRKTFLGISGRDDVEVFDSGSLSGDPDDSLEFGHTFIRFQWMFYDSECLTGVADWRDLPLISRNAALSA